MRRFLFVLVATMLFAIVWNGGAQVLPVGQFFAPAAGPIVLRAVIGTTVANCGPTIAGQTQECLVNDGRYLSTKGGAWVLQDVSPIITPANINGKNCGVCTITVSAGAIGVQ